MSGVSRQVDSECGSFLILALHLDHPAMENVCDSGFIGPFMECTVKTNFAPEITPQFF